MPAALPKRIATSLTIPTKRNGRSVLKVLDLSSTVHTAAAETHIAVPNAHCLKFCIAAQ